MTTLENITTQESLDIIWQKTVPLKINLFARCLLHNCISTFDNLLRQGLLQNNQQLCADGCGSNADINHLFMQCNFFGSIWSLDLQWISYFTVNPNHISYCLLQLGHLGGTTKNQRSSTHLLWFSCVWVIWNKRNCRFQPHILCFLLFFTRLFCFIYLFEKEKVTCHVIVVQYHMTDILVTMSHKWHSKLSIKPKFFIPTLNSLLITLC